MAPTRDRGGTSGHAAAEGGARAPPSALGTRNRQREPGEGTDIQTAFVLTVSDGVAGGSRRDESGEALARRLVEMGFKVEREAVADDMAGIRDAILGRAETASLIVATGGTGLGPRDVTPQALDGVLDYAIPGFGELMRAAGRRSTPMADLSRSLAGVRGRCLVVAVPGSPAGALESMEALVPLLAHALETLGGQTTHAHGHDGADAGSHGQ